MFQPAEPVSFSQLVVEQRQYFRSHQTLTYEHRVSALKKLRRLVEKYCQRFTEAIYLDLKRDQRTTTFIEINSCFQEIDYYLDNLKEWMQAEHVPRTMATMFDELYVVREPYGVACLIGPFNYPLSLVILPLIALIGAGNTVIIKPSELTLHCIQVYQEAFTEFFDRKFIAIVHADAKQSAELLMERYDLIAYTGSTQVGKMVLKAAAEHLTPVLLEMGGKCPAIVEEDVDMLVAARRIVWGKYINCGQTCIAPDYLLMTERTCRLFYPFLVQVLHEFFGENFKESADYGRIVNRRYFDRITNLLHQTKGKVLFQGGQPDALDLYIPPTIVELDNTNDVVMSEEIFGPILPILIIEDFEEALKDKTERLIRELRTGNVVQNDVIMNFTANSLPFGGVGHSGMGKYRGKHGFETFSNRKSVMKRSTFYDFLMLARYPPMTDSKVRLLTTLANYRSFPRFLKSAFKYLPWVVLIGALLHYQFGSKLHSLYKS